MKDNYSNNNNSDYKTNNQYNYYNNNTYANTNYSNSNKEDFYGRNNNFINNSGFNKGYSYPYIIPFYNSTEYSYPYFNNYQNNFNKNTNNYYQYDNNKQIKYSDIIDNSRSRSRSRSLSNKNITNKNDKEIEKQQQQATIIPQKEIVDPSNILEIINLDPEITKEDIEEFFNEKCIELETSLPSDIKIVDVLNTAYITFPSVNISVTIFTSFSNGKVLIKDKEYDIKYSANLAKNYNNNHDSMTYVTHLNNDNSQTQTSMETTIHEDWYCVYCDCKNFSRRVVCFRCQKPKTLNCRIVPVIKQKKTMVGKNGEILPSTSLIIQGKQLKVSNEGEILDLFQPYGQIKDIRMIKDRGNGNEGYKEYAFVEYYEQSDADKALKAINKGEIIIRQEVITGNYSKRIEDGNNQFTNSNNDKKDDTQEFNANINMTYLNNEEKQKLMEIYNLQNSIQISKIEEKNRNLIKDENLRRNLISEQKKQSQDKKAKLMNQWMKQQEKISYENKKNKSNEKTILINENNRLNNVKENSLEDKEELDLNKYNIINIDNLAENNNKINMSNINTSDKNVEIKQNKNEYICMICQRKFESLEKLSIHEKLSELHKKNLAKLSNIK